MFQSVIVKSIERNASNMYEARRQLLGLTSEPLPVVKNMEQMFLTNGTLNGTNLAGLGKNHAVYSKYLLPLNDA